MAELLDFMSSDHKRIDVLFAEAEELVSGGDWEAADEKYDEFEEALLDHFNREEGILFPAFEEKTAGQGCNPTTIMTEEHEQMRVLLNDLEHALYDKDATAYLGNSETLLMIMQQHNAKEEQMMYPMAEAHLSEEMPELLEEMRRV